MNKLIFQINDNDCGYTCFKILLANLYNDENYLFLTSHFLYSEMSFLDIKNEAKKFNLEIKGYRINDISLVKCPCITILKYNYHYHFVIVKKINKKNIHIFDPKIGFDKINIKEYENVSTNNYLLICNIGKNNIVRNDFFNIRPIMIYNLLLTIFGVFLMFLASFFYKTINFIFITILILFLIVLVINYFLNNYFMKKYDQQVIYPLLNKCKVVNEENDKYIINEYKLKKIIFTDNLNSISIYSSLGIIGFVLLINNYLNLIAIIIILIISILTGYFIDNNNYLNQIKKLEKNNVSSYLNYKKADFYSYRYSRLVHCLKLMEIGVIISINLFICYYSNNFIPFIYYCFFEYFMIEKIKNATNLKKNKVAYYTSLAYHYQFLYHLDKNIL